MPLSFPLPSRYTFLSVVGEGGTCTVVQARDTQMDRLVAIKVVRKNLALLSRFRARFAREIVLCASVVHRRLVPIYDFGILEDGRPFSVMAYADRGSLADLLSTQPPLADAIRIIDQVLEALSALHAHGLLHQDLKPANVLLHSEEEQVGLPFAWVGDLGVAGALSELAMDRRGISGTPTWMAPEQLMGRSQELGPWTDLYAVGLMLRHLLGVEDTQELGRKKLLENRMKTPHLEIAMVPAALLQVIENLLDPDPRQRYDRAADVRRALKAAIVDLPSELSTARQGGGVHESSTVFPESLLEDAMPILISSVSSEDKAVRWNRVPPGPMPDRPLRCDPSDKYGLVGPNVFALRQAPLPVNEDVMACLWEAARDVVRTHEPKVVLVVGEGGIGKSELVKRFTSTLDMGGFMESVWLRYHAPGSSEEGYRGAVREILVPWNDTREDAESRTARWLARDRQTTLDKVKREASVLARWSGFTDVNEPAVHVAVGLAFLYRHLDARAWRGGACLVLDDAEYATVSGDGLAICEALLEGSVGMRPVLAVATISLETLEDNAELAEKVRALEEKGAIRVVAKRPPEAEFADMLVSSFALAPDLAAAVASKSKASPVFAMLMLRDWGVRGFLTMGQNGTFRLNEHVDLESIWPKNLDELCDRRLEGALGVLNNSEGAENALAAAALSGPEPPASVVRAVSFEGLDSLLATGLVRQMGWRLSFEHRGVRAAARRKALARDDLPELHASLADAWLALYERTGIHVQLEVGAHLLRSGDPGSAVKELLSAARAALYEGRWAWATVAAKLAVNAADRTGIRSAQVDARERLAESLLENERRAEAMAVLNGVQGIGHIDRLSRARVQVLRARVHIAGGELNTAFGLLQKAHIVFESHRDRDGVIDVLREQGNIYRMQGRPEAAVSVFRNMIGKVGSNPKRKIRNQVYALGGVVDSLLSAGHIDQVKEYGDRLWRLAYDSGDTRDIAQATYAVGLIHLAHRDMFWAERHFQTARALAATLGAARVQISCLNNLGEVLRHNGDLENAARAYQQTATLAESRNWKVKAAVARLNLALLGVLQDQTDVSGTEIDHAERLLKDHPHHWAWLFIGLLRALWAAQAEDERACRAWWAVANERGLERMRAPDLRVPLERLAEVTRRLQWDPIFDRAAKLANQLPCPEE